MTLRKLAAAVALALSIAAHAGTARAAGWDTSSTEEESTDFAAGKAAVEARDYPLAIEHFTKVVAEQPGNADALNYLGFSNRKLGNFDESMTWYLKALAADPDHRGANEYLGELYLQMGELDRAELQLSKLDSLCFFGCEEYDDLKNAIAAYESGAGNRGARGAAGAANGKGGGS